MRTQTLRSQRSSQSKAGTRQPDALPAISIAGGSGRFSLIFCLCLLLGFAVLLLPPVQILDGEFSHCLVGIAHTLIGLCGGAATVEGAILRAPGGFAVEMKDGCNAANVSILLWAAVLAFPATWRMKLLGCVGGAMIIQAVNMMRFITLFYLGQYSARWFEFAHAYLWESLIVLDTLVVFWFWVDRARRYAKPSNTGA